MSKQQKRKYRIPADLSEADRETLREGLYSAGTNKVNGMAQPSRAFPRDYMAILRDLYGNAAITPPASPPPAGPKQS